MSRSRGLAGFVVAAVLVGCPALALAAPIPLSAPSTGAAITTSVTGLAQRTPSSAAASTSTTAFRAACAASVSTTDPLAGYRIARRKSPAVLRMFGLLDANHDGRLTPSELARAARDPANGPRDLDRDGSVDEQEFMQSFLTVNRRQAATPGHLIDHFVREGNGHFLRGRLEQALEIYRKMTQTYSEWGLCWLLMGNALEQLGRLAEARECLVLAVERMPTNRPSGQAPLFRLAILEDRLGHPERFRELVARAQRALVIEHEIFAHSMYRVNARRMWETELVNYLGYLQGMGRSREAIEMADWVARSLGTQPRIDARRLYLLSELKGLSAVLPELDRGMASGPDGAWYAVMKAALLLRAGRADEAMALNRKVISESLKSEELYAARLGLYEGLSFKGDRKEADAVAEVLIASVAQPSGRRALMKALRRAGDRERASRVMPGAAPLRPAGERPHPGAPRGPRFSRPPFPGARTSSTTPASGPTTEPASVTPARVSPSADR